MMLLDADGEMVVDYTVDAWGRVYAIDGSMASTLGVLNPLIYRGYVYDHETGLYYLNSRYYDPKVGRFINADAFVATGQGLIGNNMFAYCNNNPICCSDSSGFVPADALSGFKGKFCTTILVDGGSAGSGSGEIALASSAILIDTISRVATGIDDQFDEIKKRLVQSLAKATYRAYRTEFEEHHIAAKKARNALQAAAILNEVLPGGVEDPLKKVMLKTSVHRRVHTNLYYSVVNSLVVVAYDSAAGNSIQQYTNVISVLGSLKVFLSSLNALSIN